MVSQAVLAIVAFAASMVSALPAQSQKATVSAPVSKRDTHSGLATVYTQNGAYGSCGIQNPDSAFIGALGNYWMQGQYQAPYCGSYIQMTNTGSNDGVGGQGNSITIEVQDTCASCDENHVDLSVGAWNALTNSAPYGTVNIDWQFL